MMLVDDGSVIEDPAVLIRVGILTMALLRLTGLVFHCVSIVL